MVGPEKRLVWHPNRGNKFIVGGDASITLYEYSDQEIRHVTSRHDLQRMKCFAWSPDPTLDDVLAVGHATGRVDLVRLPTKPTRQNVFSRGPKVTLAVGDFRACNALAFSPLDHNYLAVGLDKLRGNTSLVIWDINTALPALSINSSIDYSLSTSPRTSRPQPRDSSHTAVGPRVLQQHVKTNTVTAVAFLSNSTRLLLAGISNRSLSLFDLRSQLPSTSVASKVQGIATDPFDPYRIACFGDGFVTVWDARNLPQPILTFSEKDGTADGAVLRPDSLYTTIEFSSTRRGTLATLERDASYVRFWDIMEAQPRNIDVTDSDRLLRDSSAGGPMPKLSWANLMWSTPTSAAQPTTPSPKDVDPIDTRRTKDFFSPLSSFALAPTQYTYSLASQVMVVNREGDLEMYAMDDVPKQSVWSARTDLALGAGTSCPSLLKAQDSLRLELAGLGLEAGRLTRIDELVALFWRTPDARTFVQEAAHILNYKPPLIRLLTIVLTAADATNSLMVVEQDELLPSGPILVVLVTQSGTCGEILQLPVPAHSIYLTTTSLRSNIESEDFSRGIRQLTSPMASCLMDLLLLELRFTHAGPHKRICSRYLRDLSDIYGVLPPSFLIYNIEKESEFPVTCGGFGDIYKGQLNSSPVCLKVLRYFASTTPMERKKLIRLFCREALAWKRLDHPNILPFFGIAAELFHPSFCLVSPWMRNGNIMSFLEANPAYDRLRALMDIAQAMRYLHTYDPHIVHADIRGANVLVMDDLRCCLTDFGLASVSEIQTSSTASHGSLRWMAPEYLQLDALRTNLPSRDIYAFGCTILEIYTGKPPFHYHQYDPLVLTEVVAGRRPRKDDFLPDHMWSLIEACWHQDHNSRPSAENIVETLLSMIPSSTYSQQTDIEHQG